jgi:GDP-4-dehydro-6-deoxy-D-mannose reductase
VIGLREPALERRLLVIGSGFIAAELARTADQSWRWKVEVIYRNYLNPATTGLPCHRLPGTLAELVALMERVQPTDVVIAMGSSFVPEINRNVDQALEQHLNSTLLILDAISRLSQRLAGKILVIGSASEYGEFGDQPVNEQYPTRPRDHYGLIKLALRHLGIHFHYAHGLPVIHVRQFNVTGVDQDGRFVLPSICRQIAQLAGSVARGQPVRIVAGNTAVRRDFLAIADVCSAYRALMLDGAAGEVYNICSGQVHSISDLITLAAEAAGVEVAVEVSSQLVRESDKAQAVIWGDASRLKSLGWEPQVAMRDLLVQMIDKYTAGSDAECAVAAKR